VRAEGLEPPRLAPSEPKSDASTNSATPASKRGGSGVAAGWGSIARKSEGASLNFSGVKFREANRPFPERSTALAPSKTGPTPLATPAPPGFIARHGSESALAFFIAVATRPVFRALCGGDRAWQSFSRADFALSASAKAHRCCDHLAVAPASGEIDARPEL
jgi:hypothetical protein